MMTFLVILNVVQTVRLLTEQLVLESQTDDFPPMKTALQLLTMAEEAWAWVTTLSTH